jgi:hypothetical protein
MRFWHFLLLSIPVSLLAPMGNEGHDAAIFTIVLVTLFWEELVKPLRKDGLLYGATATLLYGALCYVDICIQSYMPGRWIYLMSHRGLDICIHRAIYPLRRFSLVTWIHRAKALKIRRSIGVMDV